MKTMYLVTYHKAKNAHEDRTELVSSETFQYWWGHLNRNEDERVIVTLFVEFKV